MVVRSCKVFAIRFTFSPKDAQFIRSRQPQMVSLRNDSSRPPNVLKSVLLHVRHIVRPNRADKRVHTHTHTRGTNSNAEGLQRWMGRPTTPSYQPISAVSRHKHVWL